MSSDAIHLRELIEKENLKLRLSIPNDCATRKAMLHCIVKAIDIFYNFFYRKNKEEESVFHELGYYKALNLLIGDFVNELGWISNPVNKDFLNWGHSFIFHCGQIALAERLLLYEKADMAKITYNKNEKVFFVSYTSENLDVEGFDRQATQWYQNLMTDYFTKPELEKLAKDLPKINSKMNKIVKVWRDYFIAYEYDDPEIDHFYEQVAYYLSRSCTAIDEFPKDSPFGGIDYSTFVNFTELEMSISLKHKDFCNQLILKNQEIQIENILSLVCGKYDGIENMSRYLDMNSEKIEILFDSITIDADNYIYHTSETGGPPPPYIKVGKDSLIRSSFGCEANPFEFLNRELKRRFPVDYFKAVTRREEIFRKELNSLFDSKFYLKSDRNIIIKSKGIHTDIDAAVYNKFTKTLALFQLKWQDTYRKSMQQRFSHIKNFYPKTKDWIDKIYHWSNENDQKTILSSLGFKTVQSYSRIRLFIVSRNTANYTGVIPDKRVAWCTWHKLIQAYSKTPRNIFDQIEYMYDLIKQETPINPDSDELAAQFQFKLGNNYIIIKGKNNSNIITDLSLTPEEIN